ncbi:long-chain-fatty-acid--coa ligase [Holotrichia oblita]|uniref:Long-chain-fatty-acid--coa ligase n=1 Tax=Holotrichia oblita TaxID=644536 RepID=A0ACB9TMT8_HOLOL|nr:long-chain-fatty-acid--coa ligase [Holotrichia oblita]
MTDSTPIVIQGLPFWSPIPEISLGRQIYDSLRRCTDDEIAYFDVYTGRQLLYKDFLRLSYQLASSLQNCGYKENDVVAICSENNNNFFIPVVSALYLGMVSAPINHTYTQREILHAVNITKPKLYFVPKQLLVTSKNSYDKVVGYDTMEEFIKKHFRNLALKDFKPVDLNPFDHLAVVLCSSGTTGLPKGVMTTHDNISVRNNHMRLPNVRIIRQGYGLTEATLAVTLVPHDDLKTGSSGKVVPGMSCMIRDPETKKALGANQVGELCFKGRMITKGYYENEEATRSTFSSDGWLFTGDLGYYDEEYHFYIVDRLKELIKYKGFQVAPAELEAILIQHPQIQDVGVIGKADEEAGELPTAFVVKKQIQILPNSK